MPRQWRQDECLCQLLLYTGWGTPTNIDIIFDRLFLIHLFRCFDFSGMQIDDINIIAM